MKIFNSILAVLIHIFFIILAEGLIFYLYSIPSNYKLFNKIIKNSVVKYNPNARVILFLIYSNLFNSKKLEEIAYSENDKIDEQNNLTIIIFSVLLISLVIAIIGLIIYIKYVLKDIIEWRFICYTVIISLVIIISYEAIFLYIFYQSRFPDWEYILKILNLLYDKYYDPNKNYDNVIDVSNGIINLLNTKP